MVGAGIYVLIGTVAKEMAGPAIILSFMLAGAASMLAALCYAEFGTRIPKAGSAYVYTYVSVGEFWAFVIGWNIVLEHMIGKSTGQRFFSLPPVDQREVPRRGFFLYFVRSPYLTTVRWSLPPVGR